MLQGQTFSGLTGQTSALPVVELILWFRLCVDAVTSHARWICQNVIAMTYRTCLEARSQQFGQYLP